MKKSSVPHTNDFFNLKKRIATEAQIRNSWDQIISKIVPKVKDEGAKADKPPDTK